MPGKLRYRYRFYPHPHQNTVLAKVLGSDRVVWNDAPALSKPLYQEGRSCLAEGSNVPLQQFVRDLDQAFRSWWNSKGKVRAPRFKKKHGVQSVCFTRGGFRVEDNTLRLDKVESIPISGRYFASLMVDGEPMETKELPHVAQVGGDLGLKSPAVTSEGEKIALPKFPCSALRRLRPLQGDLNRKVEGSSNGIKARLQVAKAQAAVANRRLDFLHKLGTRLMREKQTVYIEDLNVSGMLRNRKLTRSIADRVLRVTYRWEPTSQTCSTCGHRGVNGSRTILSASQAERFNACGAEGGTDSPAVGRETGAPLNQGVLCTA